MSKKLFSLAFSPFYVLPILSIVALVALWWFLLYAPMMEEISGVQQAYKIAINHVKNEKNLERRKLEDTGEVLHLGLKEKVLREKGGFSEAAVSRELLDVIRASGASIVSLRVKPWREKEMQKVGEAEVAIRGSFGTCCAFLHNLHDRRARIKSCTIKNGNKDQIELNVVVKFYAGDDVLHHEDKWQQHDFASLKSIFPAQKNKTDAKKHASLSHSHPQKTRYQEPVASAPWVDLSKIRQVKQPKVQKDYRTKRVSRTAIVL